MSQHVQQEPLNRFYRESHSNEGMLKFKVKVESSDLLIIISPVDELEKLKDLCFKYVVEIRKVIIEHSKNSPEFLTSLVPIKHHPTHTWIDRMYEAAKLANVGPMAAVAGITSELLGKHLTKLYPACEVYIENGGDLFSSGQGEIKVGIYAGESILSNKLAIQLKSSDLPLGVCTSAGTIGHSLSFGQADAVVIVSKNTALADAVATGACNQVQTSQDIQKALDYAIGVPGVLGAIVIIGEHFGIKGQITLSSS